MYTFLLATLFFRSVVNVASKLVYLPALVEGFDCLQVLLNMSYFSYDRAELYILQSWNHSYFSRIPRYVFQSVYK